MTAQVNPQTAPALLTEKAAAERLGLSTKTMQKWRWTGGGPCFVKLGGAVRYRIVDLDAYVAENVRDSTSDRGAE